MTLRRIIYTSRALQPFSKRDLLDMLHEARSYNAIDNISGVLMHSNGSFIQVIEGPVTNVEHLLTRILRDPCHHHIEILKDVSVDHRLFSDWAMGCADFNEPQLSLIPGVRTDLSDPDVIETMKTRLPEIATFLLDNLES